VFHWCYVNDLCTTTCSGMLGQKRVGDFFVVKFFHRE
jgi:hypothetical protein